MPRPMTYWEYMETLQVEVAEVSHQPVYRGPVPLIVRAQKAAANGTR